MTVAVPQYQRFDTPGLAAADRFEYWRTWFRRAVDAPVRPAGPGCARPGYQDKR